MYSLTTNQDDYTRNFNKYVKILIVDEINKVKYEIKYPWIGKISGLKDIIYQKSKIPKNSQRLFFRNYRFKKKDDEKSLDQFNIEEENNATLHLQETVKTDVFGHIKPYHSIDFLPEQFEHCLFDINQGFISGLIPKLSENGTSGTYFLQNVNKKNIAVFKPRDEEPFMPNNPKGYNIIKGESMGFRKGIRPGESYIREIAAYLLDTKNFHRVPLTGFVEVFHNKFNCKSKKGSLQMFASHDDVAGNYSYSLFSVDEVHRIALLDIRILNCDRNEENILVKRLKNPHSTSKNNIIYHLIPIDHGLCFPDCFETINYEIVWMDWPQTKEPFSKKILEFINSIDPKNDVELLCSKLSLRKKCLQNFYLTEILLKNAANKGFTLHEIGNLIYKDDEDDEKPIEIKKLIEKTKYIYQILKSSNNKTLDKWVRRSIDIIKEKNMKKEMKKQNKFIKPTVIDEPIIEEENEEELKKNNENNKRRRSFSDNYSILEEEKSAKTNTCNANHINYPFQSPGSNSNSTEDDLYFPESLSLKSKLSKKFSKNESKVKQKSPEHLVLKRSLSLPYFKKNDSKLTKNSDELDDDSFILEKENSKKTKMKKNQIKHLKAEDIYDDMFIYYFESFLNQLLEIKIKEKNRAKNIFRNRVLSTDTSFK